MKSVSTRRSSIRFCAPKRENEILSSNFMTWIYIPCGASLYIDTALWAFRRTDGSVSLNNSAKRGMTLQPSIAWRPIAWPKYSS